MTFVYKFSALHVHVYADFATYVQIVPPKHHLALNPFLVLVALQVISSIITQPSVVIIHLQP